MEMKFERSCHAVSVYLSKRDLANFLHNWRSGKRVALPTLTNIPRDAKLHTVDYEPQARGFCLIFIHPSFPQWDVGCAPIMWPLEYEIVEIKTKPSRKKNPIHQK